MQSTIQRESDDGQTWHIPRHPPKGNTACVSQSGLNSCRDISLTTEEASSALIIRRRSRWGPPITRSRPSVHQRTAPTTPTSDPLLTGTPTRAGATLRCRHVYRRHLSRREGVQMFSNRRPPFLPFLIVVYFCRPKRY
ncbi:hypothetical protein BHE74_00032181 [Ensete ventricosum]|nr:hypothetical protein GW17_00025809 [Ensete ventricosum]RWW60797.1 hypothetical protein BHE74_00032181 [Ensete ventricosum]